MTRGFVIFYAMIFAIMGGADLVWWRIADRRVRRLPHSRWWRTLLGVWMGWLVIYLLFTCLMPHTVRRSDSPVPVPLHAAVYLWHLFILPILLILELLEALGLGMWFGMAMLYRRIVFRPRPRDAREALPARLTRRQFMGATAMAVPPLVTGGLVAEAMNQLTHLPRVRRMHLSFRQLPAALDGLTIAHVTDLHVGKFTSARTLRGLTEQINQLRCDFICVTGDLIDVALHDLPPVLEALNRLDPRHGMFVCEGNHDLFENRHRFENRTLSAGLPLLLDESRMTSVRGCPLQFLGIRWSEQGDPGISRSFSSIRGLIEPDAFPILLAHHPHAFDDAAAAGIPLTLSGHTHGGQLMLTDNIGGGPLFFRYWSGLYQNGRSSLVVSNGVGAWFPLRINAPAEIIHLTLHSQR